MRSSQYATRSPHWRRRWLLDYRMNTCKIITPKLLFSLIDSLRWDSATHSAAVILARAQRVRSTISLQMGLHFSCTSGPSIIPNAIAMDFKGASHRAGVSSQRYSDGFPRGISSHADRSQGRFTVGGLLLDANYHRARWSVAGLSNS